MNYLPYLLPVVALIVFVAVRRKSVVNEVEARGLLRNGAQLIDVRSKSEFKARHLPRAINIPLDRIEDKSAEQLPDKGKTLLLHCQSGVRSGVACKKLSGMGYTQVFNLGSYARAERIVESA